MDWLVKLCSDENGVPSSSRVVSLYLTLWGTLHMSLCTYLGIESIISGTDMVLLLSCSYTATAVKKPFENPNHSYGKPKNPNNRPTKDKYANF